MKLSVPLPAADRLLVPKQIMIRLGCMILTASGMVTGSEYPTNSSHFRLVMEPTPMDTTPMVFCREVKGVSSSSPYIMYR